MSIEQWLGIGTVVITLAILWVLVWLVDGGPEDR